MVLDSKKIIDTASSKTEDSPTIVTQKVPKKSGFPDINGTIGDNQGRPGLPHSGPDLGRLAACGCPGEKKERGQTDTKKGKPCGNYRVLVRDSQVRYTEATLIHNT